ncbi:MAG: hypothetical protein KJ995_01240 [Candidatus Omnitrophica bacterium]|nr:hypothetical protein [Candidatus Omnitrophota bacterium]MBU1128264.1 hypothetical protein [Candidatus Omnitrophota bacterium]MBU1784020.1 hypothetical protein [Candidatus Omnitrophota bacterium]MBU1851014.1 hypothetical protein [Candidatus Omnitrophota bacterium]
MDRTRKPLIVGILREKSITGEKRAPLSPPDVKWLVERNVKVEVEANTQRVFNDSEYEKAGAVIVKNIKAASLLVGVKSPDPPNIIGGKTYMIFSHTAKGQKNNITLLKEFIRKNVTLIDYERIKDQRGKRLVHFGKYAGICGMVDSLYYYARKLKNDGIFTPFLTLKQSWKYKDAEDMRKGLEKVREKIATEGLPNEIKPFITGLIGRGNVSSGVQEVLSLMGAEEVHPRDIDRFVQVRRRDAKKIYMIIFYREEKIRAKTGKRFYFEEYLEHPEKFKSNMDKYISKLNILVNASYWDAHYPRMVSKHMLKEHYNKKRFRMKFIADIACDIGGSIEATYKTTDQKSPVYTYDPSHDLYKKGYKAPGITMLAIDNLPTELPKDSSESFSRLIREYVYQVAEHGALNITEHVVIPAEIRKAVVVQGGELTEGYKYLEQYFA